MPPDSAASSVDAVTFELERFVWAAPDRLELAGTFDGLADTPAGAPVLVLTGPSGTYRLTATPGEFSGVPENGKSWVAAFVWHEAPAAFDAAALELGEDLAIDLPAPNTDTSPVALPARGEPTGRVAAEADRLALHEDVRAALEESQRLADELARVRAELDAERARRAEDAARYRAGLEELRETAEAALREDTEQLRGELATAQAEAADARRRIASVRAALQAAEEEG
jgi:hypothetical protein